MHHGMQDGSHREKEPDSPCLFREQNQISMSAFAVVSEQLTLRSPEYWQMLALILQVEKSYNCAMAIFISNLN